MGMCARPSTDSVSYVLLYKFLWFVFLTGFIGFSESTGCARTHPLHECGFQKRKPPQERACVRFVFLTAHHSKSRSDSLAYNKSLIKRGAALSEP
jgi:hypothetical protein